MKKIAFILITAGILFSCHSDDDLNLNTELIGEWKFVEVLMDPGDGSGTFSAIESEKIITFKSDGTLISNGQLCSMSTDTDNPTSGTYSSSESTFKSSDCIDPDSNYTFKQNGNILIINFHCIEPCQAKYIKE